MRAGSVVELARRARPAAAASGACRPRAACARPRRRAAAAASSFSVFALRLLDARRAAPRGWRASRRLPCSPRSAKLRRSPPALSSSACAFRCGRSSSRSRGAPDASRCRTCGGSAFAASAPSACLEQLERLVERRRRRTASAARLRIVASVQRAATARTSSCRRDARSP